MMYELLGRYFWIAIVAGLVNTAMNLLRSTAKVVEVRPEVESGRRRMAAAIAIGTSIPFLVMGFGIMTGRVELMWEYFRPTEGPPFAFAWLVALWCVYVPVIVWILAGNGARVVARHFIVEGEPAASRVRKHTVFGTLFLVVFSSFFFLG